MNKNIHSSLRYLNKLSKHLILFAISNKIKHIALRYAQRITKSDIRRSAEPMALALIVLKEEFDDILPIAKLFNIFNPFTWYINRIRIVNKWMRQRCHDESLLFSIPQ